MKSFIRALTKLAIETLITQTATAIGLGAGSRIVEKISPAPKEPDKTDQLPIDSSKGAR